MSIIVSIIIPTYNRPQWLSQAIESALAQSGCDVDVVVVDDGSPTTAAQECVVGYPKVRYHYQENQGLGAARNTGLEFISGDYVLFLDDDDWLTPDALLEKLRVFGAQENIGVVYSDLYLVDATGTFYGKYYATARRPMPQDDIYSRLVLRNFIPVHSVLWRTSVLRATGGFLRQNGLEDWGPLVRAAEKTRFAFVDKPLGYYRLHDQNMSHNYDRLMQGGAVTQRYIAQSERFATLPARWQARALATYAWQQWISGDEVLARSFIDAALRVSRGYWLPLAVRASMLIGRAVGNRLTRMFWALRSAGQDNPSSSNYFLGRVK